MAFLAALWVPVSRWRARRRARREADIELRESMLHLARRTADAVRWRLIQDYGELGDAGFIADRDQQLRRAAVLLDDVEQARRRLWLALGFPDPEESLRPALTSHEKRALLQLRQTMRLQANAMTTDQRAEFIEKHGQDLVPVPQDMFKPEDTD